MKVVHCKTCSYFSQNDGIGGYFCFKWATRIYKVRGCDEADYDAYNKANPDPYTVMLEALKEIQAEEA